MSEEGDEAAPKLSEEQVRALVAFRKSLGPIRRGAVKVDGSAPGGVAVPEDDPPPEK